MPCLGRHLVTLKSPRIPTTVTGGFPPLQSSWREAWHRGVKHQMENALALENWKQTFKNKASVALIPEGRTRTWSWADPPCAAVFIECLTAPLALPEVVT